MAESPTLARQVVRHRVSTDRWIYTFIQHMFENSGRLNLFRQLCTHSLFDGSRSEIVRADGMDQESYQNLGPIRSICSRHQQKATTPSDHAGAMRAQSVRHVSQSARMIGRSVCSSAISWSAAKFPPRQLDLSEKKRGPLDPPMTNRNRHTWISDP